MKKQLLIVFGALALYAMLTNLRIEGLNQSIAERSFSSKFGPHGYLLNASGYFRDFRFKKRFCNKPQKDKRKDRRYKCRLKQKHKNKR